MLPTQPHQFREIVSGHRRGPAGGLWRGLFRIAEIPYTCAVAWRNRQYDRGRKESHQVGVPVISVGNITMGGTGKTPMVEWLARWFRQRQIRVAIISRGYGAEDGARNDEALELEQKLPDVPHVQNPDRVAAARMAIEEFETQAIVLDDAFQHRRIHRDLNLVLIDALEPFGYDHVFPRGTLREPLAGLRRADLIGISRADSVDETQLATIRQRLSQLAPQADVLELTHRPRALLNASGQEAGLESLSGESVLAFCGIGNPAGFQHTVDGCGVKVLSLEEFPDHHSYTRDDIERLTSLAAESNAAAILCTHKDLVKVGVDNLGDVPLWAVAIGLHIREGEDALAAKLRPLLEMIEAPQAG